MTRFSRLIAEVDRGWLAWSALVAAGVLAYYAALDATTQAWLLSAVVLAAPAAVAVGILRNQPTRSRSAWWVIVAGLALQGIGTAIDWLGPIYGMVISPPSIADLFYVPGYIATFLGFWLLVRGRATSRDIQTRIDVSIFVTLIATVAWAFILDPLMRNGVLSPAGLAVATLYPLMDLAMLGLAINLLLIREQRTPMAGFLALAVLYALASDLGWAYLASAGGYSTGTIVDIGWLLAPLFWGAAALHPSMRGGTKTVAEGVQGMERWRMTGLGIAAVVGPLVLVLQGPLRYHVDDFTIGTGAALLSLLVVARLGGVFRDLASSHEGRRNLELQLEHQVSHDPLTGLANRAEFTERLRIALARSEGETAVLLLDVDDFKVINDTFGHAVGDRLLAALSARIATVLRPGDLAARLGGDEFGMIIAAGGPSAAESFALRVLDVLRPPFAVDDRPIYLHATVGIALGAPGRSGEDLMREADVAMYLAKGGGKDRCQVFDPTTHTAVIRRMALRSELEEAIERGEFGLHYQPIVSFCKRNVHACEALIRWEHPRRGRLDPHEFIGLVEEAGLIVPLGRWILRESCDQARRWLDEFGEKAPGVTVNVSAIQFRHPSFISDVAAAVADAGIEPERLTLELTEGTLINEGEAPRILGALHGIGARISIDDFGTGYSSLAYLARYDIDVLKIDRAFVAAIGTGAREDRLIAAIVNLGTDLRIEVVAEGVETEAQRERLALLGCGWFQGFLVSQPLPAEALAAMLRNWPWRLREVNAA